MGDNYLESRYDAVFGSGANHKTVRHGQTLEQLLTKNRSCRAFEQSYIVHIRQLMTIVSVNVKVASGLNAQPLRFRLVTKGGESDFVKTHIHIGGCNDEALKPESFIIICSTVEENSNIDIDLGISLQSMTLKATEMGLSGIIVRNCDFLSIKESLELPFIPIAILAIGKSAEKVGLTAVNESDSPNTFRTDGIRYVPKIGIEGLLI